MKKIEEIKINGKMVGFVREGVYYTQRTPRHFMVKFQGFGISQDILNKLKEMGVTDVCLMYYGKTKTLEMIVPLEKYLNSEKIYTFNGVDVQRFVSQKDMKITSETQVI